MTAYGISFPKMLAQSGRPTGHQTLGKLRPHSSKPAHQTHSQPFSASTSSHTNKPFHAYSEFHPGAGPSSDEPRRVIRATKPTTTKVKPK